MFHVTLDRIIRITHAAGGDQPRGTRDKTRPSGNGNSKEPGKSGERAPRPNGTSAGTPGPGKAGKGPRAQGTTSQKAEAETKAETPHTPRGTPTDRSAPPGGERERGRQPATHEGKRPRKARQSTASKKHPSNQPRPRGERERARQAKPKKHERRPSRNGKQAKAQPSRREAHRGQGEGPRRQEKHTKRQPQDAQCVQGGRQAESKQKAEDDQHPDAQSREKVESNQQRIMYTLEPRTQTKAPQTEAQFELETMQGVFSLFLSPIIATKNT